MSKNSIRVLIGLILSSIIKVLFIPFFLTLILLFATLCSLGQLSVSPIFGSNMVLQRGTTVPVFGTANPGATVTVQLAGQSKSAVTNSSGKWQVDLESMSASTSPSIMTISSGSSTINLTGVQVGEVWLCSGQSNMGFPLSNANNSAPAIADAGNHNIRLFRMTGGNGPATTSWQLSNPNTVGNFSAVGYWMGLELSLWLGNVPVGLIQATHDGTAIEHWQHTSGGIGDDYDAMVKAIQPFAIRGVTWYQGESNGGDVGYRTKLTNMLNEWRTDWALPGLPFGIIQLAYRSGWNTARNAQLEVADAVYNCFLVVIRDLPGGALHPREKKPVGIRTAIGARGMVYQDNITYSGPIRDVPNCYVSGSKIILNWKFLGGGLFTNDGKAPGEFKVATATGQFKTATAVIVGNTVEVRSPVANPAKVQYSYSSVGNLYNRVNIGTEGGSVMVDRLKVSEFEIRLPTASTQLSDPKFMSSEAFVYPNPANKGSFNISLGQFDYKGSVNVQIWDMKGRLVYHKSEAARALLTINSILEPGIYTLEVKNNQSMLLKQKIVVQ
jgi:sialate O-acetylesterase